MSSGQRSQDLVEQWHRDEVVAARDQVEPKPYPTAPLLTTRRIVEAQGGRPRVYHLTVVAVIRARYRLTRCLKIWITWLKIARLRTWRTATNLRRRADPVPIVVIAERDPDGGACG
jgi:hypothetical protein